MSAGGWNIAGLVAAAVIGLALHHYIEALLGAPMVVAVALVLGGIAIILIERTVETGEIHGVAQIPFARALGIGFLQCLAMIPGVSRSGATIMGALTLGVDRKTAAEFSFFLAIPTMLGATTLELWDSRAALINGSVNWVDIAIGFVIAFLVAALVIKWLVGMVSRSGFYPFAWYRIVIGLIAIIWLSYK